MVFYNKFIKINQSSLFYDNNYPHYENFYNLIEGATPGIDNPDSWIDVNPSYLSNLPFPEFFEEFNIVYPTEQADNDLNNQDITNWNAVGRPDIATYIAAWVSYNAGMYQSVNDAVNSIMSEENYPNYTLPSYVFSSTYSPLQSIPAETNKLYNFVIRQVSNSRKEIRLKFLNEPIVKDDYKIEHITSKHLKHYL